MLFEPPGKKLHSFVSDDFVAFKVQALLVFGGEQNAGCLGFGGIYAAGIVVDGFFKGTALDVSLFVWIAQIEAGRVNLLCPDSAREVPCAR